LIKKISVIKIKICNKKTSLNNFSQINYLLLFIKTYEKIVVS